ncbi:hypothetical protein FOPE_06463 [Fonsecaea pedrosoi]|nr:hypothetical protein FOPE_06463 [Fonsecaea pedrosoi]
MQREFQNTDNKVGKGFAVLGIYLFVVSYCELLLHPPPTDAPLSCLVGTIAFLQHSSSIPYLFSHIIDTHADGFINSVTWLYGAEVLPVNLRSKVMGLAAASHFIVNVGITEAGPSAFANIKENYYYVFVGCSFFFLIVAYFYFPPPSAYLGWSLIRTSVPARETKKKTLEEIAAAFGDKVVLLTENDLAVETAVMEDKGVAIQVESASTATAKV